MDAAATEAMLAALADEHHAEKRENLTRTIERAMETLNRDPQALPALRRLHCALSEIISDRMSAAQSPEPLPLRVIQGGKTDA